MDRLAPHTNFKTSIAFPGGHGIEGYPTFEEMQDAVAAAGGAVTVHEDTELPQPTSMPFTPRDLIDAWEAYPAGLHLFTNGSMTTLVTLGRLADGDGNVELRLSVTGDTTNHAVLRDWGNGDSWFMRQEGLQVTYLTAPKGDAPFVLPPQQIVLGEQPTIDPQTGTTPTAIRVGNAGGDPRPLPSQEWVTVAPSSVEGVDGAWSLDRGVFTVPESGVYSISGTAALVPAETTAQSDLYVRIAVGDSVVSGDAIRVGANTAVARYSGEVALLAGDKVMLQVFADSAGIQAAPGTLQISFRRVGATSTRSEWVQAPWPFALPVTTPEASKVRSIEITIPPRTLGADAPQRDLEVATYGGATALNWTANQNFIPVGGNVGRLFRVSGRVASATAASVEITGGSPHADMSKALYPGSTNPSWPKMVKAKATATRADFAHPTLGCATDPSTIYVSGTGSALTVKAAGAGASTGGKIVLTDITPNEFVGSVIRFDPSKVLEWRGTNDRASASDGVFPATADLPLFTWETVADKTSPECRFGRAFFTSNLPNGYYRIKGSVTLSGPFTLYVSHGWDAPSGIWDEPVPGWYEDHADGTRTWHYDYYYRLGGGGIAGGDGGSFQALYFNVLGGARTDVKGRAYAKPAAGTQVTLDGAVSIELVTETVKPWYELEIVPHAALTSIYSLPLRWKDSEHMGRVFLNDVDTYAAGYVWENSYGVPSNFQYPLLDGSKQRFPDLFSHSQAFGMNRPTAWKWTLDVSAEGALLAGYMRCRRQVGNNDQFSTLQALGKDADGNFAYRIEGVVPAVADGGWWQRFGQLNIQAAVKDTPIRGTFRAEAVDGFTALPN